METKIIDPVQFGLSSRTQLEDAGGGNIALIMRRKSRIIMKDGGKILEIQKKVLKNKKYKKLILKTDAPVCSKTQKLLTDAGIHITALGR